MHFARPAFAPDPRAFGRRYPAACAVERAPQRDVAGDVRLFATTFAAGFLFISVFIA